MRMIKNMARRSIRALGYDLKQRRPDLVDFLRIAGHQCCLDVGANRGQFGARLRADGYFWLNCFVRTRKANRFANSCSGQKLTKNGSP